MPRLADDGPLVNCTHGVEKCSHQSSVKRQRRRQLQEERPSFVSQAIRLSQKRHKWFLGFVQLPFVRNRPRYLDRKPKIGRGAATPFRVGGRRVWPIERGIDLRAIKPARVALEMGSRRLEAQRRSTRDGPTRRPDSNVRHPTHRLPSSLRLAWRSLLLRPSVADTRHQDQRRSIANCVIASPSGPQSRTRICPGVHAAPTAMASGRFEALRQLSQVPHCDHSALSPSAANRTCVRQSAVWA